MVLQKKDRHIIINIEWIIVIIKYKGFKTLKLNAKQ